MRSFLPVLIVTFGLSTFVAVRPAVAQDRAAVEFAAGWVGFGDDGIVSETLVGGSGRWYVSPRISIGPEVVHLSGQHHSHVVVTGNLVFDLLSPVAGRPRMVTPFVVAGAGMFRTNERFFDDAVSSSEGAFTVGGGIRAAVGERVTLGLDARLGWEPHIRINGTVGVRFGP